MQSAIKTCLAVAMLSASVEALEIEKRGGGRGGGRGKPGRGRGKGGFSCDKLDDYVEAMGEYDYQGDGVAQDFIDAFTAAVDCSDTGDIAVGRAASKAAKEAKCVAWCELKEHSEDCEAHCASSESEAE